MLNQDRSGVPFWAWGVAIALLLILISSARGGMGFDNPALRQRFQPQPTDPAAPPAAPLVNLGDLPAEVQALVRGLQVRLQQGNQVPALTPVAGTARLQVEVRGLEPVANGVRVTGSVTNISGTALDVPVRAFQLRDSAGAVYASSASNSVSLAPGASTPLDLTVPLPPGRGLHLRILLPPDPPIEQLLLVGN